MPDTDGEEGELPLSSKEMSRLISRIACCYLNVHEQAVLWFIYERTFLYKKVWDQLSEDQFLNGVIQKDTGKRVRPGLAMSRAQFYRAMNGLHEQSFVIKQVSARGGLPKYRLNWERLQFLDEENESLCETSESLIETDESLTETLHKGIYTKGDDTGCAPALARAHARDNEMETPSVTKLRQTIAATKERSAMARHKQKKKLNATALMKIWQDAFSLHFPDDKFFMWRTYEQAAFKRAVLNNIPNDEIESFVTFAVEHFANVIREAFGWMKQPPLIANVGFVTTNIEKFYNAFRERNDPNRRLKGRIGRTTQEVAKPESKEQVAALKRRVRELEEQVGNAKKTTAPVSKRTVKAKRLIKSRLKRTDEFGGWDE